MSTVLVVDDSDQTHALVRRVLAHNGHISVHATGADEALRVLERQSVDAMIVDLVMPHIDGIQLTQLVRSRLDVQTLLPVVFYSAHGNTTEARRRISTVQPATIVAKDGNIQDLVEALTNVIEAHAGARAERTPASVIVHIGKGLVGLSVQRDGQTVYELRRGTQVLLQAPTVEALIQAARRARLA